MNKRNCKAKCFICKKEILVFRASLKSKRNFCSQECETKWRKEYWEELQKNKSFGFQKGHKLNIGNKFSLGNHPRSEWKIGRIPWNNELRNEEKISKKLLEFSND